MPELRRRPTRRQAVAVTIAAGALAAAGIASSSGGAGAAATPGPTAEAAARTLRVTDSEPGTLGRADTTNVLFDGTGGHVGGGPPGSDVSAQSTGSATPARFAAPCPTGSTTTAPSTPSTSSPSTTPSTTPSSLSTTTSTSTSTTAPCATTTTTAPPATTSTTQAPTTTRPPTTTSTPPPVVDPGADDGGDGSAEVGPSDPSAPESSDTGSSTATLTELIAIGDVATRGSVLYRADDEPIVALLAPDPLFRDLRTGITDGPDVEALERNLVELGQGSGVTVDEHFDAGTAAAVRRWEEALGRQAPDGVVTVGEVVLLAEPTAVLEHSAAVGDLLEPGDAVLVLGAQSRVIETDVLASHAADWPVGTAVTVDWGDGTTTTGSVVEASRDVVDGDVALVVALADGSGTDRPVGAGVDVLRTVSEREGATAVPVSAVVAGPDGPAVRVAAPGGDRLAPVQLGIVDDGWVEVTDGVAVGTAVRLPG